MVFVVIIVVLLVCRYFNFYIKIFLCKWYLLYTLLVGRGVDCSDMQKKLVYLFVALFPYLVLLIKAWEELMFVAFSYKTGLELRPIVKLLLCTVNQTTLLLLRHTELYPRT